MLVHDRATPLARRRTPEGFLEMCARIGRAGLRDDRAESATTSQLVAELQAAIVTRDEEIAKLRACAAAIAAPSPKAVKNRNDADVAATVDSFTALSLMCRSDPSLSLIALQVCNEATSNAWRPEVAKVAAAATKAVRSWRDTESAAYLTQPRDGDGRRTSAGISSFATKVGLNTFVSARVASTNGYMPSVIIASSGYGSDLDQTGSQQRAATARSSSANSHFSTRFQIAYPDGRQACHEKCLEETDHIRGSGRPAIYRKCVRKCLGPDADY